MPPKLVLKLPGFPHLKFDPHGTFATVTFDSALPVVPIVVAGFNKPTKKTPTGPDFQSPSDIRSTAFPLLAGLQTSHEVELIDLVPDTEFWVVVKGKNHFNRIKSFKTRRRRLDVDFQEIHVIDDSDDLSPGDFWFGFYVNGKNAPNGKALLYPKSGPKSISSGEKKTIPVEATVFGGDSVKLKVTAVDNDDDPDLIVMLDTTGTGFWPPKSPDIGSGSDSTFDWVSAQSTIPVDFPGHDEDRTIPFQLDGKFPKKTPLHFKVKGTVKVSHP
jgi:hypothetical protein